MTIPPLSHRFKHNIETATDLTMQSAVALFAWVLLFFVGIFALAIIAAIECGEWAFGIESGFPLTRELVAGGMDIVLCVWWVLFVVWVMTL